jgi:prepilin-type N-terminal cleavage/methylation domain-containing protein
MKYAATPQPLPSRAGTTSRGFTLLETLLATAMLGVLTVASMQLVTNAVRLRTAANDQTGAMLLAQSLADEISTLPYEDPTDAAGTIGPEADEPTDRRSAFDDVDDYHNFAESGCCEKDGTCIPGGQAYRRTVTVEFMNNADPRVTNDTDMGIKRVTVRVERSGKVVGEIRLIRSRAVDLMYRGGTDLWSGSSTSASSSINNSISASSTVTTSTLEGGGAQPMYSFSR